MSHRPVPMALIILDGFGYSESSESNAILAANTPNWDKLWQQRPRQLISASGVDVGLPDGQMGNSEVGHLNLGSGRVVYQDFSRISAAIENAEFFQNTALCNSMDKAIKADKAIHILGLLSPGGVHSHEQHIFAAIRMAASRGATQIYLHAFLDGRDTPPQSALASIEKAQAIFAETGCGRIASISGRYYAMDRDNRWDRIEMVYQVLTDNNYKKRSLSATEALADSYAEAVNDEFVKPVAIEAEGEIAVIEDGDSVIFMNFRADRARELTVAFTANNFSRFYRQHQPDCDFICLTEYAANINSAVAFKPTLLKNVLGEVISDNGLTQLRIAETEKYAHVTFFFSGGKEEKFPGETRELIPSPQVATYDLQPEMNAPLLTEKLLAAIASQKYDLIVCNYANADMVGHTGNFAAAVKAIEALDVCLGQIEKALIKVGGEALITADHGNAEQMQDVVSGQAHTAHTTEPVPLVYIGRDVKVSTKGGTLSDIAPTLLYLMDIEMPAEMTGSTLFTLDA